MSGRLYQLVFEFFSLPSTSPNAVQPGTPFHPFAPSTHSLDPCMFSVGASRAPDFFIDVLFEVDKLRPREQIVSVVREAANSESI